MRRIAALLRIGQGEYGMTGLVALIFFFTQSTQALTANTADTLFFTRFGVEFLPGMFILFGFAGIVTLLAYATGLSGMSRRRFYPSVLIFLAVALVALRLAIELDERWVYAATWVVGWLAILVTYSLMWNVASDVVDARSGKRLFPLFASAGILGGVAGALATGPLAGSIGVENILFVVAGILVVSAILTMTCTTRYGRVKTTASGEGPVAELKTGYSIAAGTRLMRQLAVVVFLGSILTFVISFAFSTQVAETFTSETEIARFLGLFAAIATSATLFVSLFGVGSLFRKVGIIGALMIVGFVYLGGFGLWLVTFSLVTASIVRLLAWVGTNGVDGTASAAIFNAIRSEHRGSVMGFMRAVPQQLGVVAAGVVLLLAQRTLSETGLFVIGAVSATLFTWVLWSMRASYLEALVKGLREGVGESLVTADRAVQTTAASAETVAVVRQALASDKPEERRAALELAWSIATPQLAQDVTAALADDDIGVRVAAVEALVAMEIPLHVEPAEVFGEVDCLYSTIGSAPPSTWRRAGVVLDQLGQSTQADEMLGKMTTSPLANVRAAGLIGFATIGRIPEGVSAIEFLEGDQSPAVRAAAARAVATSEAHPGEILLGALEDGSAHVRRSVADAWISSSLDKRPLLDVIASGSPGAQEAALIALSPVTEDQATSVHEKIRPLVATARADHEAAMALGLESATSEAAAWLADLLEKRSWTRQKVVVRAIEAMGDLESTELIIAGLKSEDDDAHAQALEALDEQRDEFSISLLELVEQEAPSLDTATVLIDLIADRDEWIRALAATAAFDTTPELSEVLDAMESDPSPIVSGTMRHLLANMGSELTELFDVVSPVERVMVLRGVPIFGSLSPEDLHRIAASADERNHAAGSRIFKLGDPGTEMVVVVEGTLAAVFETDDGRQTFAEYGPGEQVGELSLLRGAPRASDVIAVTDVRLLGISAEVVDALLAERPDVSRAILASLANRLAAVTESSHNHDAGSREAL